MRLGAERRLGIGIEISEFVVREEDTLSSRLAKHVADLRSYLTKNSHAHKITQTKILFYNNINIKEHFNTLKNIIIANSEQNLSKFENIKQNLYFILISINRICVLLDKLNYKRTNLNLIRYLILHCWDQDIVLPALPSETIKWWQRPIFSVPLSLLCGALFLYLLYPVGKSQALAVPPITIRADVADPEQTGSVTPEIQLIGEEPQNGHEQAELHMVVAPEPSWQPVNRAFPSYHLQSAETEGMDFEYRVYTRNRYANREVMHWHQRLKQAEAKQAEGGMIGYAHIILERFEQKKPPAMPFLSDLSSRAAEHDLSIERISAQTNTLTKFGAIEIAEAVLKNGEKQNACLLFRHKAPIGFIASGWYCGIAKKPVDRVSFACFINKIDLIQAGQDLPLRAHFAAAERLRTQTSASCGSSRQAGRKTTWLDYESPLPELKLVPKREK